MNSNLYFLIVNLLFSFSLCELSVGQKETLLNGFIDYYNNLPNQVYSCQEGLLQNTQQVDDIIYKIVADIEVTEISNSDVIKILTCIATIQDLETGVSVDSYVCQDSGERSPETTYAQTPEGEVTKPDIERKLEQLENVQETAITSGEEFITVPQDQPSVPINPQAVGVTYLANLGVRHLDVHEPSVKHSLDTVLYVERQVQILKGTRYVLTLSININKCSEQELDDCTSSSRICNITILVKPWVKLPSGGNYKAILANNCTKEWRYDNHIDIKYEVDKDLHKTKRDISSIGGEKVQNPTDPTYKQLAEESLRKYEEKSGITHGAAHGVVRVERVTTQIVSGSLTNINFKVLDNQNSTTLVCNSKIWEKTWLKFKSIEVTCVNDDK